MITSFPAPWRIVEIPNGYAVEDATGLQLGVFYGRAPDAAGHTGIMTMDEARHMALDFAKLNRTVQWPRDGVTACRPPDRKCRRQIRDVPFFWLNYCHPNGCFAG